MQCSANSNAQRKTAITALVFALSFLVIVLLAVAAPAQAHAAREYGVLCSKYETGNNPAEIDPNCAYGAYQMSPGHAYSYASWLKEGAGQTAESDEYKTCVKWGKKLLKAYKNDGNYTGTKFDTAWVACNSANSELFFNTQYSYCKTHYYDEAVKYWKIVAPGFNPDNYSIALRCALFSTAIQHGPYGSAYYILKNALDDVGGWKKGMAEDTLINAIYFERSEVVSTAPKSGAIKMTGSAAASYGISGMYLLHFYSNSSAVQVGVYNRLHNNERKDALAMMLNAGVKCTHGYVLGGNQSYKASAATDTKHCLVTTSKTCATCGKKITVKATTEYVKHKFNIYKKGKRKCACGVAYKVHSASKYYRATSATPLRESAKKSSKQTGTVAKGTMVKPQQVKVGSDGNYWAKLSISGATGWASMKTLSVHGNGSTGHVFQNGKCKYCKAKQITTLGTKKGKYRALKKTRFHKAAYNASKKGKKIKKGKTVKVTKIVRNCYGNLWGKTKYGYVELKLFKNPKIKLPKKKAKTTLASGSAAVTQPAEQVAVGTVDNSAAPTTGVAALMLAAEQE